MYKNKMTTLVSRTYSASNFPKFSFSTQFVYQKVTNIKKRIVFPRQVSALNNSNISKNGAHNQRNFSTTHYIKAEDDPSLWVSSKVTDFKPCVGLTIPEMIRAHSQKLGCGDAIAFECAVSGVKYTHNQVWAQSRGFATSLLTSNLGLKRGDVIAVLLHNIPEYGAALFGIWDAGLIATTMNPAYTLYEIKHQLKISNAKAVLTLPDYLPAIREASVETRSLPIIIISHGAEAEAEAKAKGCFSYFDMVKTDPTVKAVKLEESSEVALLPFSSGTTGAPKGVVLTHSNLATNLLQVNHLSFRTAVPFEMGRGSEPCVQSRLIGILPMFHAYGLTCLYLSTMLHGAHTMMLPKFSPNVYIDVLRRHKPTVLHLVPPILAFTVQSKEIGPRELESVQNLIIGAAPVGLSLLDQLLKKAGGHIMVNEGYGMTEMSPTSHFIPLAAKNTKLGSVGVPVPLTTTKVIDVMTGATLPLGEKGELCVKGPQVMKGYLNNEEATKNTIDPEGWLHTGDIGYYDKDDYFYIVDRLKELIKVKGFQVAPSELEDLLRSHKQVADVAVIGVPNVESGEVPRAYVVKAPGSNVTEGDIKDFVKGKVAKYKELKGGVEFVQEIPRSSAGKILRRVLLDEYKKVNTA